MRSATHATPRHRRATRTPGQALVEFAIVIPIFMLLLTGMMEFGFAFGDRLTLGNASREGARVGSSLVSGNSAPCSGDPAGVDKSIIASVQFILKSGGSDVRLANVSSIRIFKASSTGAQIGSAANVWAYTPGAGPDADPGPGVELLDFSPTSTGWPACSRNNASSSPNSIGVSISYQYRLQTPLAAVTFLLGGSQGSSINIVDTTVMALNPTS